MAADEGVDMQQAVSKRASLFAREPRHSPDARSVCDISVTYTRVFRFNPSTHPRDIVGDGSILGNRFLPAQSYEELPPTLSPLSVARLATAFNPLDCFFLSIFRFSRFFFPLAMRRRTY